MSKTNIEKNMEEIMGLDENEPSMVEVMKREDYSAGEVIEYEENDKEEDEVLDDFEYARQNIRNLIDRSLGDIEDLSNLARTSESPRAYEVLSSLTKNMIDANKDLMELRKKKNDLKSPSTKTQSNGNTTNVQNNVAFVGTTAELLKMINQEAIEQINEPGDNELN